MSPTAVSRGIAHRCSTHMCLLRLLHPPCLLWRCSAVPACLHTVAALENRPAGCTYAAVERVNRDTVKPLIDELVKTPFFRYFKAS